MANAQATAASVASQCRQPGCNNHARSVRSGLCEKHYYRLRRRGTFLLKGDEAPPPREVRHSEGYVIEYLPSHPLWGEVHGRVYQHRRVFFDNYGKGPHPCHWCGKTLHWDEMDVDHVNAVRDDNEPANLVASCRSCNVKRGCASMTEIHRARSKNKITFMGETLTEGQWAGRIGISRQSLRSRLAAGWPLDRALTQGRGPTGPR